MEGDKHNNASKGNDQMDVEEEGKRSKDEQKPIMLAEGVYGGEGEKKPQVKLAADSQVAGASSSKLCCNNPFHAECAPKCRIAAADMEIESILSTVIPPGTIGRTDFHSSTGADIGAHEMSSAPLQVACSGAAKHCTDGDQDMVTAVPRCSHLQNNAPCVVPAIEAALREQDDECQNITDGNVGTAKDAPAPVSDGVKHAGVPPSTEHKDADVSSTPHNDAVEDEELDVSEDTSEAFNSDATFNDDEPSPPFSPIMPDSSRGSDEAVTSEADGEHSIAEVAGASAMMTRNNAAGHSTDDNSNPDLPSTSSAARANIAESPESRNGQDANRGAQGLWSRRTRASRRRRAVENHASDQNSSSPPTPPLLLSDSDDSDDHSSNNATLNSSVDSSADATLRTIAQEELEEVLNKPLPSYSWNSHYELMRREHGLTSDGRRTLRPGMEMGFNTRCYGSRHIVERIRQVKKLRRHNGCVNSLNFHKSGDLLVSGSDDTRIIVWHWTDGKINHIFKSGHLANVFQTKFVEVGAAPLDIVSSSHDGQIRRHLIQEGAEKPLSTLLYRHRNAVHKLTVCPQNCYEIITCGDDGFIRQLDLRKPDDSRALLKVTNANGYRAVRLFSISHHPFAPQLAVSGCDNIVRVYDKRSMRKVIHQLTPPRPVDNTLVMPTPQVTCCVYDWTGREVLASYSDDSIYLFDNVNPVPGKFLKRYRGHYNHRTIKGVNFFGLNSEYVVSGSDCGYLFFWDKNTEAIVNYAIGDASNVINCLEPHPTIPLLATSGLEHCIKLWAPKAQGPRTDTHCLHARVKANMLLNCWDDSSDFDEHQFHYFIREFLRRPNSHTDDSDSSNDTTGSSSPQAPSHHNNPESSDDDHPMFQEFQCRTQ